MNKKPVLMLGIIGVAIILLISSIVIMLGGGSESGNAYGGIGNGGSGFGSGDGGYVSGGIDDICTFARTVAERSACSACQVYCYSEHGSCKSYEVLDELNYKAECKDGTDFKCKKEEEDVTGCIPI